MSIARHILGAGEGRVLRRLKRLADEVSALGPRYTELTDAQLRGLTDVYRARYWAGETLDDLLVEAFATAREAAHRVLGQRHYDVQVIGGAALHFGNIAEMRTGEGKTLTSVLPVYLNALAGNGVHVLTVNDYLARRDAEWMGQIHSFLGLSVGVILPNRPASEHRAAYACDITYGTCNEFGFDYLRDNIAVSGTDLVQRGLHFAVVDEVDSILIDEARTPLIISGPGESSARWYSEFARVVSRLRPGQGADYEVDIGRRTVSITEAGVAKVEDWLGLVNLYESVNTPLVGYLNNALKAKELYQRDQEYIVADGEVLIVDEFTGRILRGRRYNDGIHQAIEAKEGVVIMAESQTLARTTLQNYFRLYTKLSGMTGTAAGEALELHRVYGLGVVVVPTNKPMVREDRPDVVYRTERGKFQEVVADIVQRHHRGQPVLVGTSSVEKSELLSTMLREHGIPHSVLNAKHHAREAEIVAQAGRRGAITVTTNMAGRGTDILLGGNPDVLADGELAARGIGPDETPGEYATAIEETRRRWHEQCLEEAATVRNAGGLYVLGTERHDARRIDDQLRGRSGRQGDPGESRFYLSLQDSLMQRFRATAVEMVMDRFHIPEDVPIESNMVTRQIRSAQEQIEAQNAGIRKNVLQYDEVLNVQRQVIYAERRRILAGEDLRDQMANMIADTVSAYVAGATADGTPDDWDFDELWAALSRLYPVTVPMEDLRAEALAAVGSPDHPPAGPVAAFLTTSLVEDALAAFDRRETELGADTMRELERQILLNVIDRRWRDHLYEMDYLQEGASLRAYGQRDPLVEFQREGFQMFAQMLEGLKEDAVGFLFNLDVQVEEPEAAPSSSPQLQYSGPSMHDADGEPSSTDPGTDGG